MNVGIAVLLEEFGGAGQHSREKVMSTKHQWQFMTVRSGSLSVSSTKTRVAPVFGATSTKLSVLVKDI